METLRLSKAIQINGKEFSEIPYDFENMTAKDKIDAGKAMKAAGIPLGTVEELDSDYHFYLFAAAASKANSEIDISDVLRMSAKDAQKASEASRCFFYMDSEE